MWLMTLAHAASSQCSLRPVDAMHKVGAAGATSPFTLARPVAAARGELIHGVSNAQLEERLDPTHPEQADAWAMTASYLEGRIQDKPEQKPGRQPDMSEAAAAAMMAVMGELCESSLRIVKVM